MIKAGRFLLSLDTPLVMGIVNVTPDSFSDGGRFLSHQAAISHALQLVADGADILDIGGESTRPGAAPASAQEELDRVMPVIHALASGNTPLSIDTQKPVVMAEAIRAGVSMVNDVSALRAPGALEICAASDSAVCLMHMQGEPRTMQENPTYGDVVAEVRSFLLARVEACIAVGIARKRIVVDPGFGFGKSLDHNLALLRQLDAFASLGLPVLAGLSRKAMFKALLDRETSDRLVPSVVAAVIAAQHGASILRVHDVRETRDALVLWKATSRPPLSRQ
ncbi:MAG: dihydropteroate synthase [Aeromicrobium sp.]|nr:dihydropteroate synthase [Burkholderiales bacterium]